MMKLMSRAVKMTTYISGLKLLRSNSNFCRHSFNHRQSLETIFYARKHFASEATLQFSSYDLHKLEAGPPSSATVTRDEALKHFEDMKMIRRLETVTGNLYKAKKIRGFCHLSSGQEAIAAGMSNVLRPQDTVITSYRCHGWAYVMGASFLGILSEMMGGESGLCRAKGGSMHLYSNRFYGGNAIVGGQVPLGVGIAFFAKYTNTGGVCIALYGDGAANQGQIFEAFNIAKLLSIPCIFVCENNHYGMGTRVNRAAANPEFYTRGDTIPGIRADGMDVLAMREVTKFAIDFCISGKGPILLEAATYRYLGHSMSDPGLSYRTRDEVKQVRETKDPITQFGQKIRQADLVTEEDLKAITTKANKALDEAVAKASADKQIGVEELTYDVYSDWKWDIKGIGPWTTHQHKLVGPTNK